MRLKREPAILVKDRHIGDVLLDVIDVFLPARHLAVGDVDVRRPLLKHSVEMPARDLELLSAPGPKVQQRQ